ncbi:DUF771 domain-containing protein [Bacillus suaedae]|uniref:DUF771 domain-containing protein n=1 Tax=Halalkalibacter suaedae TaxID=2822140 RepID=A0A940X131_9BACI|nr:DUF771 domain-containing protein [Bacillus suaedae]MBP3953625.1 DUF771 domain-containing protein [Bacillus suaedae]
MQRLNVSLTIDIPEEYVLITKLEFEELKSKELSGVYWNMKDLELRVNRKQEWIKENVLYPIRFRRILDSENGGFVFYPRSKGQTWSFQASKMAEFLDDNFVQIFSI